MKGPVHKLTIHLLKKKDAIVAKIKNRKKKKIQQKDH